MRWLAALLLAGAAEAQEARFAGPTDRYGHAIMGDLPEWTTLCLGEACVTLPETSVFEDLAPPRTADMDGDGVLEAVVVESSVTGGAALAIYQLAGAGLRRVATPPIGRRNRWLAPVGVADFDGDGRMDVAYVDRPHLAKVLRVWSWEAGNLVEVAAAAGVTSHRIGEEAITGGVRDCGAGPEMVVADAGWREVLAVRLVEGDLRARSLGGFSGQAMTAALACE